ncbi:MAG: hypothetical protein AVDCRST_MAG23-1739 [uncultured Sphingosinicella sp.]|uniref:DUF6894 domain-containing protein n=1 Tax=uncultured Sphingosinicella sp. TaxID=478748 RepID=A0A6J4U3H7_9SPHN|nr:hypothetical protein [uncultured Sphingosinicella sp.]CAA9538998.1 MAG: hypothetical protein AVDCRST_MAG23-1739 [uncultured Sphingosinicella sp.]
MPLYFFHLRDSVDILLDPEGRELSGADAIPEAALKEARWIIGHEAMSGRIRLDQRIDVEDEFKNVLHSVNFVDAVEIVHP